MILISSLTLSWILFSAASACAFMIGLNWTRASQDDIISHTIMYMVDNNIVKWRKDENGEIELLQLDE